MRNYENFMKINVVTINDIALQVIFLCNSNNTNIVYMNVEYGELTNI